MAKNLVIVESPAKVKTIEKFLGKTYEVTASNGHVRDMPKSQLGFDPENGYEPKYITIRGKGDILAELRKKVKKADNIYLATDPDREGEAISWHLSQALDLSGKNTKRITFNEITKNAVKESLKHPRDIDSNLVNAQQARRMLDRMVGYRISPLLWTKIKRGLSAGRVQSVALRIICDREDSINSFIPVESWTVEGEFFIPGQKKAIPAHLTADKNGKISISNKAEADNVLSHIVADKLHISELKTGERVKKAPLPFKTSTLQQEASKHLNFSTQKTMRVAQQLYEGVQVKGEGTVALISYLRTDSTRVSDEAQASAKSYILENFSDAFATNYHDNGSKGKVQDAHEAIRPTDVFRTPVKVKDSLTKEQFKLYQLIWNRFLASQMSSAVYETVQATITDDNYCFQASGSKVKFEGFLAAYSLDEEKAVSVLSGKNVAEGTKVEKYDIESKQHFTQPPAHFTEASLVKTLEELGIGRPSTYAPTITTLLARHYILKDGKNIFVSELGEAVNEIMTGEFSTIVDENFTANMESLLDKVEEGTVDWKMVVSNFYPDLEEAVKAAHDSLDKIKIADEVSDVICDKCGRNMVIKYGPHGKFLGCPGFPECRNTMPLLEKIGITCPKCGGDIIVRKTKRGRRYYGCTGYPECDFMSWQKPSDKTCPECGSLMIQKGKKLVCSDEQCGHSMEESHE